jgi:hypothetical protein
MNEQNVQYETQERERRAFEAWVDNNNYIENVNGNNLMSSSVFRSPWATQNTTRH